MKIKIQAELSELSGMREKLSEFAELNSVASDATNLIVLSIDEICTNLIKYAYNYNKSKTIDISVKISDNKFITTIKDTSEPFDIRKHAKKNIIEHVRKLNVGGLGMHIVLTVMDEIYYEPNSDVNPQNTLTLIKKL